MSVQGMTGAHPPMSHMIRIGSPMTNPGPMCSRGISAAEGFAQPVGYSNQIYLSTYSPYK